MPVTSEYVTEPVGVEAGTPCARRAARQRTFAVASLTATFVAKSIGSSMLRATKSLEGGHNAPPLKPCPALSIGSAVGDRPRLVSPARRHRPAAWTAALSGRMTGSRRRMRSAAVGAEISSVVGAASRIVESCLSRTIFGTVVCCGRATTAVGAAAGTGAGAGGGLAGAGGRAARRVR